MSETASVLAPFAEFNASASWRAIDFISDLHLAEDTPRTFDAFAAHLRYTTADAVFILGDLFEVWVGDDARHDGFAARVLRHGACPSSVAPNDWFHGRQPRFSGGQRHAERLRRARSTRPHRAGRVRPALAAHARRCALRADLPYQRFRSQVRSPQWQHDFLDQPLDTRRQIARGMRQQSEQHKASQSRSEWVDVDTPTALQWMRQANVSTMIHGHTHMPGSETMAPGVTRHVLSDWDLDHPAGTARADVLRWQPHGHLTRLSPATAG